MGDNITEAERLLATIMAGRSRVRDLGGGLPFETASRLETRGTVGSSPTARQPLAEDVPDPGIHSIEPAEAPPAEAAPVAAAPIEADPPLFAEFLPEDDLPTSETAAPIHTQAPPIPAETPASWDVPEDLAPAIPIAPPDVQPEPPDVQPEPPAPTVPAPTVPAPRVHRQGSHFDFRRDPPPEPQPATPEAVPEAALPPEDVPPSEPDFAPADAEPIAEETDVEVATEADAPAPSEAPDPHHTDMPTAPADLPPILNAAPPARPRRTRKKLPPPHPALATAAPPALSQPKAVAPRIVDPNAPSLAVVFEPEAPKADTAAPLQPAPELTPVPPSQVATIPAPAHIGTEAAFSTLSDAIAAVGAGRLEQAIHLFGDVLDIEPEHMAARIGRGRAYIHLRQYAAAMSDFQKAEDTAPESAEPLAAMGDLFFARKDYTNAISRYDKALDRHPEHAMSLCRRGIAHHYLGRLSMALEDIEMAREIDPSIPSIDRYVVMIRRGLPKR